MTEGYYVSLSNLIRNRPRAKQEVIETIKTMLINRGIDFVINKLNVEDNKYGKSK